MHGEDPLDARSRSDVDGAVESPAERSLRAHDRVRISIAVEDLLRVPRVDVVVLAEASGFLAVDVIRDEVVYTTSTHSVGGA